MAIAGALELQFYTDVARLRSDMADVKAIARDAAESMESGFEAARKALELLGIGLSVEYFKGLVEGSISAVSHLEDLSKTTGLTVETLSGLRIAAKLSGTDLDSLTASIDKLSVNIGKAPDKFRELGVSAKDPLEAFLQLVDILNSIDDRATRNAVAAEALGKSWATVGPLIGEGSDRIRKMIEDGSKAAGVTNEMAKEAKALEDKWTMLVGTGGAVNRIVADMLGPLNRLIDTMNAAKTASSGFGDALFRFLTVDGSQSKDPASAIAELDVQLQATRKTLSEFQSLPKLQQWLSGDDIAVMNAKVAILEKQRSTLVALQEVQDEESKPQSTPRRMHGANERANRFLHSEDQDKLAKQIEEFNAMVDRLQMEQIKKSLDAGHAYYEQQKKDLEDFQRIADEASDKAAAADDKQRQARQALMDQSIQEGNAIADGLRTQAELEAENYNYRLTQLNNYLDSYNISVVEKNAILLRAQQQHEAAMGSVSAQMAIDRRKFSEMNMLQQTSSIAGMLESLTATTAQKNREMFELNKIASIANAVIKGQEAVLNSYAWGSEWGGPAGGALMAGIAAAAVAVNIANIAGAQFGSGAASSAGGPSVAPPVNVTPVGGGTGASQGTTVILQGDTFGRKQVQAFLKMIADEQRNGGQVVFA